MAKQKKPVNKKKSNFVADRNAASGVVKNKTGGINKKNKKNKKIDGDNGFFVRPDILSKKTKNQPSSETTVVEKENNSPQKRVIPDVIAAVTTEMVLNPKISKKRSKKKIAKASTVVESPTKVEDTQEDNADQQEQTKSDKKPKKMKIGSKEDVVQDSEKDVTEIDASSVKITKEKLADNTSITESDPTTSDTKPMVWSVFVGNLPTNTKRVKLLKMFSKFGKIKSIRFRLSNGVKFFKSQSKVTAPNVIAFVDFENEEDAKSSLVLNGEKIKDNVIRVNLQSNAKTTDSFDGKRTIFVGNLKYSVTDQNLHDLFSCCGGIEYARTMQCEKGCNGIAYVCFKKTESVGMALELNQTDVQGRPVRVQRYVKKTSGGPKDKKIKKEKPTGAVRRLEKKHKVKTFSKDKEHSSKKQFSGMKAKDKKKNFVKKNKKPLKGPKLLAKKIASREKESKTA